MPTVTKCNFACRSSHWTLNTNLDPRCTSVTHCRVLHCQRIKLIFTPAFRYSRSTTNRSIEDWEYWHWRSIDSSSLMREQHQTHNIQLFISLDLNEHPERRMVRKSTKRNPVSLWILVPYRHELSIENYGLTCWGTRVISLSAIWPEMTAKSHTSHLEKSTLKAQLFRAKARLFRQLQPNPTICPHLCSLQEGIVAKLH